MHPHRDPVTLVQKLQIKAVHNNPHSLVHLGSDRSEDETSNILDAVHLLALLDRLPIREFGNANKRQTNLHSCTFEFHRLQFILKGSTL